MKKKIMLIAAVTAGAVAAMALCSCNEYKEAQDDFASNITSLMSEAQDIGSELNEHTSEFQEAASNLESTVSDIRNGVEGAVSQFQNQGSGQ